ncbi:MAG: sigma-70 family RNA polymerase sigma factor [Deltaproteobacteria bacterium]|nr:sigma-70 family RNA polymerase sigma factor [Deltaproteobacteria bacterium]
MGFFHAKSLPSFEKLYEEYQGMVRHLVFRMVGEEALEDLVQESFLRIWRGLPKFKGESSLKTWVYRVATNVCLDFLKKQKKLGKELYEIELGQLNSKLDQDLYQQKSLHEGLNTLKEEQRTALILFYWEELSLKEIAKVLGVALGTVQSRVFHGRKNLLQFLKEKGITL